MKRIFLVLAVVISGWVSGWLTACTPEEVDIPERAPEPVASAVPIRTASVAERFPHSERAFTQGLLVHQGRILESVGQNGQSALRQVDLATGKELRRIPLGTEYFAEGLAVADGKVFQLTWLNQRCFIYDAQTLNRIDSVPYLGEGWGLATDGSVLYMSNGTNMITVRNPADFQVVRTISVTRNGSAQTNLNELEWVEGRLWANVWTTDNIVSINPSTGVVEEVIDLSAVYPVADRTPTADVLNGIAYDSTSGAIYVTGKNWPELYRIEIR